MAPGVSEWRGVVGEGGRVRALLFGQRRPVIHRRTVARLEWLGSGDFWVGVCRVSRGDLLYVARNSIPHSWTW